MNLLSAAVLVLFPALVIVAALRDLTSFTIPNWISAALILAFAPAVMLSGLPMGGIGAHLLVGLIGLGAALGMFAVGWIGGGDAKLFAASMLWLGWPAGGAFILVTGLAGGALAVGLVAMRSQQVRVHLPNNTPAWAMRLLKPGGDAPYGVAIACGALYAFPMCDLIGALKAGL
jgi:prepilin peptidase CpaA